MAASAPKLLYAKTLEEVTGVLVDIVQKASPSGKLYLDLVFESGEHIAMPDGFRVKYDLFAGSEYHARWDEGKFSIVPTSVESETADTPTF